MDLIDGLPIASEPAPIDAATVVGLLAKLQTEEAKKGLKSTKKHRELGAVHLLAVAVQRPVQVALERFAERRGRLLPEGDLLGSLARQAVLLVLLLAALLDDCQAALLVEGACPAGRPGIGKNKSNASKNGADPDCKVPNGPATCRRRRRTCRRRR